MKKITYLLLLISVYTFGQSKEYLIKTEKKSKMSASYSFRDQSLMVCTSMQTLGMKSNKPNVIRLDHNLNEIYNIGFIGFTNFYYFSEYDGAMLNNYRGNPKMTVIKEAYHFINEKGELKEVNKKYVFGGKKVEPIGANFLINNYQYSIGTRKGREFYKKVYSIDDFYLYKLNLITEESETLKMDFRNFSDADEEQKFRFELLKTDKESFTLKFRKFSRDRKERKYDQFVLLTYDLEGNEIKETIIESSLSEEKNIAFNKIIYNKKEKVYFSFGFYHEHKDPNRKWAVTNYKGYYIQKFDDNGKILWKVQSPFSKGVFGGPQSFQDCVYTLNRVNTNELLFSYGNTDVDVLKAVVIDKITGKTKEEKTIEFKLKYQNYKKYPNGVEHRFIKDVYGKNNFFDIEALQLLSMNNEFSNYAKQFKDSEKDMHFKSFIIEDGFLILQIDNENSDFKVLKFDW